MAESLSNVDINLGGNIVLSGFDVDQQQAVVVKKMVGHYAEKIRNFREFRVLKVEMKSHEKGKKKQTTSYEIKAMLEFDGDRVASEATGLNLFVLLDEALGKILKEIEHKSKFK